MNQLTVVVTNFRREQHLKTCLRSLKDSGIPNVVVTSSEPTKATEKVINDCKGWFLDFRFTSVVQDQGNNEAWLRGLRLVKTPWVYILHDDDVLIPSTFVKMWPRIKQELINGRLPVWQGQIMHGKTSVGVNDPLAGAAPGMHPSRLIVERLHQANAVSISPVLGIFRTDMARRVLAECEHFFKAEPQRFYTRPNMMVGNDMLLWLYAAEQHPEIYRFAHGVSGHGYHPTSETVRAFANHSALNVLRRCYAETQKHHRTHRYGQFHPGPAVYHIVPGHPTNDANTIRRNRFADASWAPLYNSGNVQRLVVESKHTPRNATIIGEKKDMPFVRDVFDYSAQFLEDHDWMIFTNRDICISPGLLWAQDGPIAAGGDCFYSHRMDTKNLTRLLSPAEVRQLGYYPGADLFAMRAHWWKQWRHMMPDMLIGFEAWDSVLWTIMDISGSGGRKDFTPLIYHEWHESHWENNKTTTPGQKHNRRLAKNFLCTRHGYRGNLE